MEKLNLVRQFSAFHNLNEKNRLDDKNLKASAIALYMTLLGIANAASHEGGVNQTVTVDNKRLMSAAGIGSNHTLAAYRKELIEQGLIVYKKGGLKNDKRVSGEYTLVKLY